MPVETKSTPSLTDTTTPNRLSYSQLRLYSECGQKYKYYYIDRIRETTKSGALFFGSAFDKAITAVLQDRSVNEKEVFDKVWQTSDINGKHIDIPTSLSVVYAASDFDSDLLMEEDTQFLCAKAVELVPALYSECNYELVDTYSACASHKKQRAFKRWPENENRFLNLCNWLSLRRKGHLMLDAHRKHILPRYKSIIATQKKIELDNGKGDILIGYPDLIAEWDDGRTIVFDYKTSASEYEADAVLTSTQLTIYSHSLGISTAGYLVFRKQIIKNRIKICSVCGNNGSGARHKTCANEVGGKRCNGAWNETISPEVEIQILIDDIPARTEDIVLENIEACNKGIHEGVFVRNFNSCKNGYGNCPYLKKCFQGIDDGLEKV
jgi:hypothetical protein